jgi:two-component system response regulator YesN
VYNAFILDDEPFVRARIKELIDWKGIGFSIVGEASNGEDGYRKILSLKPDLVVTDIRMPVFSGLELIRKVTSKMPNCRFIIFSGYNDFDYAHEAMKYGVKNYLLKPVNKQELEYAVSHIKEELNRKREQEYILRKSLSALREKWARDVLFRPNASDIITRAKELKIDVEKHCYTIIVIDSEDGKCKQEEENEKKQAARANLIRKALDEILRTTGSNFVIHDGYDRYIVLYMFPKKDRFVNLCNRFGESLLNKMSQIWEGHVTVGYSDIAEELSFVSDCYKKAEAAIEYKFVLGKNKAIGFHDVAGRMNALNWNKILNLDRASLYDAIKSMDRLALKTETEKLFGVLRELMHAPEIIRGVVADSLISALGILIKLKGDVSQIFEDNFNLDEWIREHTLNELEKQFFSYCVKIMDHMEWILKNRPDMTTRRIMEYIQKHYTEDITLKSISRLFYMNPAYLGQLFKNSTGVLFNQYLTEIRMKAAKNMLLETDLSICDIAEKCGYKVIRSFYTAFKKYYNCTPNEYRSGCMHDVNEIMNGKVSKKGDFYEVI